MNEKDIVQEIENVEKETVDASQANNEQTVYKEERFEFALYVNNNLVCKRNFKMYNFIEGSMQTVDFGDLVDEVVEMIDADLKSKSRVYTWMYYDPEFPNEEFESNSMEPWESTFKFVIYDDKREVYSRIWDGYGYPAAIRNNVDIANNVIKILTRSGDVLVFDRDTYFEENKDKLSIEMYVKKAMMGDKPNLLPIITKRICETCSPWNNSPYEKISDYHTTVTYGKGSDAKTYNLLVEKDYRKYIKDWEKAVEHKTKAYFGKKR